MKSWDWGGVWGSVGGGRLKGFCGTEFQEIDFLGIDNSDTDEMGDDYDEEADEE